jgi:predicted  nucleic acid-binding Zn-ribbon protein
MARPLPLTDSQRNGTNGFHGARTAPLESLHLHSSSEDEIREVADRTDSAAADLELVRAENAQLRALCQELEQALQEAAQQLRPDLEQQVREYDAVLEEKNELIGRLHQQVQELQAALESAKASPAPAVPSSTEPGKLPSEAELLALSEQLERERKQLQDDEQTLMDQMREMEVSMARERAELARQRNDMQRLQNEVRHELERLERDGGIQSKIEELRNKLQDVTARRGAPPASGNKAATTASASPSRKEGLMGRLFKRGSD